MATYTLDAQLPGGAYAEDHGLTEQDIRNALHNAPQLGITILSIKRDDVPLDLDAMRRTFGL